MRNKSGTDIGLEKDHHVVVSLCFVSGASCGFRREGILQPYLQPSGEVAPLRREIISAINAVKRSKAAGLGGRPAELFMATSSLDLLVFVRKSCESETFPRESKKEIIVRFQKGHPF